MVLRHIASPAISDGLEIIKGQVCQLGKGVLVKNTHDTDLLCDVSWGLPWYTLSCDIRRGYLWYTWIYNVGGYPWHSLSCNFREDFHDTHYLENLVEDVFDIDWFVILSLHIHDNCDEMLAEDVSNTDCLVIHSEHIHDKLWWDISTGCI